MYKDNNIIFLDIDGVLNNINYLIEYCQLNKTKGFSTYNYPFDPKCLYNLQRLIFTTNSNIVITSTWRKSALGKIKLMEVLKYYNLDTYVIGWTPILNKSRGSEIKVYLNTINHNCNFIILDDDDDMDEYSPYLIKTNVQTGLLAEHVEEAIYKLSNHIYKNQNYPEKIHIKSK